MSVETSADFAAPITRRSQTCLPPRLMPAIVAAGILCRLVQYLWDRSFWADEAMLVLNIRGKTAGQLLGKLEFHQVGPPFFLLCERGLYRLFGGSELSLRLLPLLASCASVVLLAMTARRLLRPWPALIAIALFAFSDRLIWHSAEVKPYAMDVFAATVLMLIGAWRPDDGPPTRDDGGLLLRQLAVLCASATVLTWLSFPSVLVFGGISLALLPAMARRGVRGWVRYVACNLPVALSFAVLMHASVRVQSSAALAENWSEDFVDFVHPLQFPIWLARRMFSLSNYACAPAGFVLLPCAVAGAVWMARRRRWRQIALLINPIGLNLLAAALHRYPFDGSRVTVYLTPAVLLLSGAGIVAIYQWLRGRMAWLAVVPGAIALVIASGQAAFHLPVPRYRSHLRPVAAYLREHACPDDAIYALQPTEFACYWPAGDPRVAGTLVDPDRIPSTRFWIVWAFPHATGLHRLDRALDWARTFAVVRTSVMERGGCAYLFEITANPRPATPAPNLGTHHRKMAADDDG